MTSIQKKFVALLSVGAIGTVFVNPAYAVNSTSEKVYMNFSTPANNYKPLTRWWVPGDQMTKAEIKKEIESMVNAGFGGAEIVPVSTQGGDGEGGISWGTERWKELTKYMLDVAAENNFTIDFTMTPAWPLALPTIKDVNDPLQGAQMELDGAYIDGITKSHPFSGQLPRSEEADNDAKKVNGQLKLIAVTVAKYIDKDSHTLDLNSAKVLNPAEMVSFTPTDDGEYVLFAWYQHPSGNTKYENNQVDHFSKAGTQMVIDYWEKNLIPYYGDSFKNVRSLFVDSLEFETHLDWTYNLLEEFQKSRNYDITPFLPALYDTDCIGNYMGNPVPDFKFNKDNEQILNDFREFMTELYINNHVKPLEEFCARHGVNLRYQTSYGKNLELAQTALYPDIPESETLYGGDYLDFYRSQSGAVHVANKKIYSLETAAEWTEQWNKPNPETGKFQTRGNGELNSGNYEQTFQNHLWHDQRAFSTGVNQVVFHGYAYNGQYDGAGNVNGYLPNIHWAGFTGFPPHMWSNSWGERQPLWLFASKYTDYLSRLQYILQQGQPKIDLAIYNQIYYEQIDFVGNKKLYNDTSLEQNGYTYDFISHAVFENESSKIANNYKAVILNNQSTITLTAAKNILSLAKSGLPVIIVGNVPDSNAYIGDNSEIKSIMQELLNQSTVVQVANQSEVITALKNANVYPDSSYNAKMLNVHRSDNNVEYYYLYNYGNASSYPETIDRVQTSVTLQGKGIPYYLDAWSGDMKKIPVYTVQNDSVVLNVDLAGNDSKVIALINEQNAVENHAVASDFDLSYNADNDVLIAKGSGHGSIQFADGGSLTLNLPTPDEQIILNNWSLSVESWTRGNLPAEFKKSTIDLGKINQLQTWDKIPSLKNVSGVGTYTSDFYMTKSWKAGQGAYLDVGKIKDAYEIKINGQVVTNDQLDSIVDIGPYLVRGRNVIEIKVATALLNAVLKEDTTDKRDLDSYGLSNDVKIIPYSYQMISFR